MVDFSFLHSFLCWRSFNLMIMAVHIPRALVQFADNTEKLRIVSESQISDLWQFQSPIKRENNVQGAHSTVFENVSYDEVQINSLLANVANYINLLQINSIQNSKNHMLDLVCVYVSIIESRYIIILWGSVACLISYSPYRHYHRRFPRTWFACSRNYSKLTPRTPA